MHAPETLVVSQDAGPAAYLSLVAQPFRKSSVCVASPASDPVFRGAALEMAALDEVNFSRVQVILAGTTLTSLPKSLDKRAVELGKSLGIPTICFVEHWTWLGERFWSNGELLLPDAVVVNDMGAKKAAMAAGLPENRLYPLGNPRLEIVHSMSILRDLPQGSRKRKPAILLVAERLSDLGLQNLESGSALDEIQYFSALLETLCGSYDVSLRIHPSQVQSEFSALVARFGVRFEERSFDEFAPNYDLAVGFYSMLLVEFAAAGGAAVSYLPINDKNFIGSRPSSLAVVTSTSNLIEEIEKQLHSPRPNDAANAKHIGSLERILKFIESVRKRA